MAADLIAAAEPIGDTAVSLRITGGTAGEVLRRVRAAAEAIAAAAIPGVVDVVAAPGRVGVAYDPRMIDDVAAVAAAVTAVAGRSSAATLRDVPRHEIAVAYDGPDLDELCAARGIDRAGFVAAHTEPDYVVEAIGFLPGFGYLAGMPPGLATPRRSSPRRGVPAGAVGIGGGQTGIYPFASPGGWNLVGRAAVRLFDPDRSRPALLGVGDTVRLVAADPADLVAAVDDPGREADRGLANAALTVIEPGLFTTVQDLGRPGHRAAGVPLSGAADRVALRLANLVVGNAEDAAALECTLVGPRLRFDRDTVVALAGATFPGLAHGKAIRVAAGGELTLGHATAGCRGYLAVAGGIDVEPVLGSRSTLVAAVLGGFAGRPLRTGDRLPVGRPTGRPSPACLAAAVQAGTCASIRERPAVLRLIPAEAADIASAIWSHGFRASSRSDRMGLGLEVPPLVFRHGGGGMTSVPVFPGTVQLPPDGRPIVLLADAQTIGGYPVLGQVIAADLPRAAQLRPGDEVRLEPVSLDLAREALLAEERTLEAVREATS